MTKEEFRQVCLRRGYAFSLQIQSWIKRHPKDEYTEADAEAVYNYFDGIAWHNAADNRPDEREDEDE